MEEKIIIKGAKVNNLQNIDVEMPRSKLIVITGLSGSGKTSLAFDTLYAEGQRRYIESLSSYARQFMGKIAKPEVDYIKGIPPAIAIEQKVINRNVRSTVGTTTEIYEYLKLLFSRIGHTYSPISNKEVKRENIADVLEFIQSLPNATTIYILAPLQIVSGRSLQEQLEIVQKQGFNRLVYHQEIVNIEEINKKESVKHPLYLLIDRFKPETIESHLSRVTDSIQIAFKEGKGNCLVQTEYEGKISRKKFSNLFELDDISFEEPSPNFFSFNNPYGACKVCNGLGMIEGISEDLVIPDRSLSVIDGAVTCWRGEKMSEWRDDFIKNAVKVGFPIYRAVEELTEQEFNMLWLGDPQHRVYGVLDFFNFVQENIYKIQYRVLQSRYKGQTLCPDCRGTHLRKDANYVKVNGKSISDLVQISLDKLHDFFVNFKPENENEGQISQHIIQELVKRTGFLVDVGLGYLTLNRSSRTLSGGESQRINLATSLGSSLVGSLYILDEPSIGLHPKDTLTLVKVLQRLRDIGNTVVVVEHDEDIIRNADYIIDIGPYAGSLGGKVVFEGNFNQLIEKTDNLTAGYLRGMENKNSSDNLSIALPAKRRKWKEYVEIVGAKEHNLKNITVKIPLQIFVAITGVSGSGKTSLIRSILYPALQRMLEGAKEIQGKYKKINVDLSQIKNIVLVDQNPLGRSSRSNPATFIKAYDDIRDLFANQPLAKQRNCKSGFFSMNIPGGRCEECQGEGMVHVGMQFMADLDLVCPECNGFRFKDEVLEIKINEKNVFDILRMTINEAVDFFKSIPENKTVKNILDKLILLQEVGLGYLQMGQSSSSLSGGEAQRVKLAYYLSKGNSGNKNLFIFDEPTTGLHFHDINKLYHAFNKLIENDNSIIVIEHNMELIKCADWVIDLGKEGGEAGGQVVGEGTPEQIAKCKNSYTGYYLKDKL
ncbi:MAG: excinuclease ABC subunit UvrA [Bacteroidales bacterium]|jgi:excinuclease ABC subunit A|nr:excinuclease ABC subunit UvrA [Bacteroidales bacterium]